MTPVGSDEKDESTFDINIGVARQALCDLSRKEEKGASQHSARYLIRATVTLCQAAVLSRLSALTHVVVDVWVIWQHQPHPRRVYEIHMYEINDQSYSWNNP